MIEKNPANLIALSGLQTVFPKGNLAVTLYHSFNFFVLVESPFT